MVPPDHYSGEPLTIQKQVFSSADHLAVDDVVIVTQFGVFERRDVCKRGYRFDQSTVSQEGLAQGATYGSIPIEYVFTIFYILISVDRNANNFQRTITNVDEYKLAIEATGRTTKDIQEQRSSYPPFDIHDSK
jgi:hypothetical protein